MDKLTLPADRVAVVFIAGDLVDPRAIPPLPDKALLIAADGGIAQAELLGVPVDLVVGDMDSADPESVRRAQAAGATVERHPRDKDATDLELALTAAVREGCGRVLVVGGVGGRLDHLLGNVLLIFGRRFEAISVDWWTGHEHVACARRGRGAEIAGDVGDAVSLIPLSGPATGVVTKGLRWPLTGDSLTPDSTLSISNELVAPRAAVAVETGTLLIIHTEARLTD